MKKDASPKYEILSLFEKGQSEKLLKLDKLLLCALTLVYTVIALVNLGTLSFPTTVYRGEPGDRFTLDFGQTVNVDGVTAKNDVDIGPEPVSHRAYCEAGVYCSSQGNGSLTFVCADAPTANLTVNVRVWN